MVFLRQFLLCILLLTLTSTTFSCYRENDEIDMDLSSVYPYTNPPYPVNRDSLRVLVLGNSFSENATSYLNNLIKATHIDRNCVGIYTKTISFSGIDSWIEQCNANAETDVYRIAGELEMKSHGRLLSLVSQKWDVIVILQASNIANQWKYFYNLPEYIKLLTTNCTNKDVCLVYQIPWSHTPNEMPQVLDGNIDCCFRMKYQCGINEFIPVGTAIQLARTTYLNDKRYLTSDNWHLNDGIGQYIASCTWFQKIIAPVFNVDIMDNTVIPIGMYSDDDVTIAKQCAIQANNNPFNYK